MGFRSVRAVRIGVGLGVLWAAVSAAAVALQGGAGASTLATASLSISPASQSIDADEPVSVEVSVNNVSNMAQWDFTLWFDEDVLTYSGATPDKAMLSSVGTPFCTTNLRKSPPPPVGDGVTILGVDVGCATSVGLGTDGADGSGKLATINFTGKAAGKSALQFTRIELGTAGDLSGDNYDIPATGGTGVVCVGCSALEPTPTYNPSLATPITGDTGTDPVDEEDPNAPAGGYKTPTPRAGVTRPTSGAQTSGGTSAGGANTGGQGTATGTLAGATVRSGSGSAPRSGVAGAGSAAGGEGFPVAGTGATAGGESLAWPVWVMAVAGVAGVALVGAGAATSRRKL